MSLFAVWLRSFCTETTMLARHVRDAHGGVGLVHVLAAGAGRAERVDADVVVVDLDVAGLVEQRRDDHLREARVPAVRLVERAQAHEAVLAALGLEDPVRVVARDGERRRLDAVLLARARLEHLGLEAAVGGPAQVHAQQDLGPVLRVGAARVGLDRHDRVAGVVLAGEERVLLQPLELAAQRHDRRRDVVGELVVELEQLLRVGVLARAAGRSARAAARARACSAETAAARCWSSQKPGCAELLPRARRRAPSAHPGQR